MTRRLRKVMLTAHVTFSVGWLGADAAFLALAIVGMTSQSVQIVRAAYLATELIGLFVIVPFSFAALLTGLTLALGTPWGLFRHYWILVKFLLTIGAITVLLVHTIFETVSPTVCVPLELGRKARCFIAFTYCGTFSRYIKS